ncbi:ETC complex I subunit conserved region-domain-containing protein [Trametes polyzona]|nr:ETC complex I subunit conserved region-domain-containing protein [Trametes polyzona]
MSLLRSCQQAVRRPGLAQAAVAAARTYATDSNIPQTAEQKDAEITQAPSRDVVTADIVSGAPKELRHRTVRIFQPTRSTTQSGPGKSNRWRIDWDILPGGGRWENPLMGWASSADYMQGTRLSFRTKEDAIHFAEKQGWDYYIGPTEINRIPPKNYAENFVYKPGKLRLIRTK